MLRINSPRILSLASCLLTALALNAQSNLATIQGTISDPSGAAIVDAQVSVTNAGTNVTVESRTNSSGIYVVPFLQPGIAFLTLATITSPRPA